VIDTRHQFDVIARTLAVESSRRGALRGAAVVAAALLAALRGPEAVARRGQIPLGGACRHTSQCLHHAVTSRRRHPNPDAVYCEENGFRYDGKYNCCRHGGGRCTVDEQCCGSRHFCRNGTCVYLR
jgi:hypothetical protein